MRVSVVMPAYNAERHLDEAIRSVLAQTCGDWELLVIDDGSTDGTARLARALAAEDGRVRLLKNGVNRGASESRNRGVREARGEWVAFLDADDLWRADKLEKQLALLDAHPGAALSYTASAFIDEDGAPYGYVMPAKAEVTRGELLRGNLLSCSSVMAKRELLLRHPFPGDAMHEDYAVWLALLREVPCAYGLDEPLLIYRLARGSKSAGRLRSAKMLYRAYRFSGYNAAASAAMTLRYAFYSVRKRRKIYTTGSNG